MSKINNHNQASISNRRRFLKTTANAAACLGLLSLPLNAISLFGRRVSAGPLVPGLAPEDMPKTHNMMIVGSTSAYVSHLPMFEGLNPDDSNEFASPHRRQVIMEVTFTQGGKDVTPVYLADRISHPQIRMYTLRPSEFVLGRVDPAGAALKSFEGNAVFRGHLERPPRQRIIGASGPFQVNVKNVIYFHKFDPRATKPKQLEYILFGKGAELFLAHLITLPNDFDQIISIKAPGHGLTDAQLSQGLHVVIASRDNDPLKRLKEKDKTAGNLQLAGGKARTLSLEVVREFYFEESELDNDGTMGSTQEETRSGFPSQPFVPRP
jgi:hypothetical protein